MAQNAPPPVVIPMAGLIEQPGNDSVLIPVNHPLAVQFAPFLAPPAVPAQASIRTLDNLLKGYVGDSVGSDTTAME